MDQNDVQAEQPQVEQPSNGTAEGQPQAEQLPEGVVRAANGNVQILSQNAYNKHMKDARERGRRAAMTELEDQAKAAGFASFEAMRAWASSRGGNAQPQAEARRSFDQPKRNGNPQGRPNRQAPQQVRREEQFAEAAQAEPPTPPSRGASNREWNRYERERARAAQSEARMRERLKEEADRRRAAERERDEQAAEQALHRSAYQHGASDVDVTVELFKKHVRSLSERELNAFDEDKWWGDLREKRPYLFGERVTPATTGTGAGVQVQPPKPGQVAKTIAANGKKDFSAKDASGKFTSTAREYQEELRRMGLSPLA